MNPNDPKSWFDRLMRSSVYVRWGVWLLFLFSFLDEPDKRIGGCRYRTTHLVFEATDCTGPYYFYTNLLLLVGSFLVLLYIEYKRKKDKDDGFH